MTNKNTGLRRLLAGTGAFALALAGTFATGQLASAAPGPGQDKAPTEGSLTIFKYRGSPTSTPSADNLLAGVEFKVTPVGRIVAGSEGDPDECVALNLGLSADWDGLDELFTAPVAAPGADSDFCLVTDDAETKETSSADATKGQAVFDPLDLGVYFVEEGADNGNNNILTKAAPFYVSVPLPPEGTTTDWTYDVVVKPKNSVIDAPSKTIDDPSKLTVGAEVTYNLSVPVPNLQPGEKFTVASITDTLDSRLTYVSSTLTVDGTGLVEGADGDYVKSGDVVWTFTEDGRGVLDGKQGKTVEVTLVTKVNTAITNGEIPNDKYDSNFNNKTTPGEVVPYTYWGELKILKTDGPGESAAKLAGAEFKVFEATEVPGEDDAESTFTCAAKPPAEGEIAVGESNSTGVVQWKHVTPNVGTLGLWIANSDNGELVNPSRTYCVYETVVPIGHTPQAFAPEVVITPGAPVNPGSDLTIQNPPKDGPDLPLTGAQGTIAMSIGGLLLVGAGVAVALVSRRRNNAAA